MPPDNYRRLGEEQLGRGLSLSSLEMCPHRLANLTSGDETARCDLLARLLRVDEVRYTGVRQDACVACCAETVPTMTALNPVVAALLHSAAERLAADGGAKGCDLRRAEQLVDWADLHLRVLEKPAPPDPANVVEGQAERPTLESPGSNACELADLASPSRHGQSVRRWAVGVTTSPRQQSTLATCLAALKVAGWEHPWLFMDGPTSLPPEFEHLPVTFRPHRVGAWASYYLALHELLLREPDADAYMIVQDDALLYQRENLREYLQETLWPSENLAAVSLFCSTAYVRDKPAWYQLKEHWIWGAQAFVFPADALRRFLVDPIVLDHRRTGRFHGLQTIDIVIGGWAQREGLEIWYPYPSLCQHIGETSTLWPQANLEGKRSAEGVLGDAATATPTHKESP